MSKMIEVMIDSVRVSLTGQQRIVLLRRLDENKYLPIWIGPFEAESITIALQEIEMARPQTHDLLLLALAKVNTRLVRVEIVDLKEDVFYGNLVVEKDGEFVQIDARPSDSIALAVRAHVPILVDDEIFTTAGILPAADLQIEPVEPEEAAKETAQDAAESKKRLSVYEDFLQNLDLDDNEPPSGGESPEGGEPSKGKGPDAPDTPDKK